MPVLLERKDGRIYFWDGKVGTKTRYGLMAEVKAMSGAHFHGYDDEGEYARVKVLVGGRLPTQPLPDRLPLRGGRLYVV